MWLEYDEQQIFPIKEYAKSSDEYPKQIITLRELLHSFGIPRAFKISGQAKRYAPAT